MPIMIVTKNVLYDNIKTVKTKNLDSVRIERGLKTVGNRHEHTPT